jgi:hypothetical protein
MTKEIEDDNIYATGGEYMSPIHREIAEFAKSSMTSLSSGSDKAEGFEAILPTQDGSKVVSTDSVEDIVVDEDTGNFFVHLIEGVEDVANEAITHKVTTIAVIGAAVLSFAGSVHMVNTHKKHKGK